MDTTGEKAPVVKNNTPTPQLEFVRTENNIFIQTILILCLKNGA